MATAARMGGDSALPGRPTRYREPEADQTGGTAANLMTDRRVVRGNTYAAQVVPANAQAEAQRLHDEQRRAAKRRQAAHRAQAQHEQTVALADVPPEDGRQHAEIQTDSYLEELTDRPVEVEAETQTAPFMDRPPSPLYMPAKEGVDVTTQIEDGDLFDFEMEAEPILEVLVGKTLEQSMLEVMEEEEMASLRRHKEAFRQRRNAELAEVQRLEAEERRRLEEKERRVAQARERSEREQQVRKKVAARAFAKQYMRGVQDRVFGTLAQAGHFYDPLEKEVREQFMPWLDQEGERHVRRLALARACADLMVKGVAELKGKKREQLQQELAERRAKEQAEEEARVKAEEEAKLKAEADAEEAKGEGEEEGEGDE